MWCYGLGRVDGVRFERHSEGLDVAARARLPRQRRRAGRSTRRTRSSSSARAGSSAAARSTSRSTASSSRSTTSSCSAASARSAATRAGRSRGSSRRPRRSRRCTNVFWNVGKYGDLHPFAALEPVHVGGVTVKLATLHNEEDLRRKDIRPGDEVIVTRAGDVIPQVISPAPHAVEHPDRAPPPEPPATCPVCDTPTIKREGEVFTRCPNRAVPRPPLAAAQALRLRGRDGHRGPRREAGRRAPARGPGEDRRRLLPPDARAARRASSGSARCRRTGSSTRIQASKERPFGRVLFGIGIEGVGGVTGRNLAQRFRSIDALMDATAEQIAETPGIGPKVAALIHEQLRDADMIELVARPPGARPAARERGRAARRGPADRQDARAHGHAAGPDPGGGDRAHPRRRRPGHLLACRRRPTTSSPASRRARSSRRPSASACRCSTRPGCSRCWRATTVSRRRSAASAAVIRSWRRRAP